MMSDEQGTEQMVQGDEGSDGQNNTDQKEIGSGGQPGENADEKKLFVGGLSWETKEEDLKEYMSKFGAVENCTLKKDMETNKSRGFGFVVFEAIESLEKVLAEPEHKLHGKKIDPKRANPKGNQPPQKKIYVAKVQPSVTEDQIKEYFAEWGTVEKVEAPFDKEKGERKNFVFVEFTTEASVDKLLKHSESNPDFKHSLGGEEVEIRRATQPQRGRGRGGFFRGGDRGRGRGGYGGYGGGGYYDNSGGYSGYGNGYGGGYGYGNNYGSGYGYGGYDNNYYNYPGGWGGYDQSGYNYGYGGYDYGWGGGYGDQSGQQMAGYGKAPKSNRGGSGYRPY